MADHVARLARDPRYRRAIVEQARHVVETELADPESWWRQWKELLNDECSAAKPQAVDLSPLAPHPSLP